MLKQTVLVQLKREYKSISRKALILALFSLFMMAISFGAIVISAYEFYNIFAIEFTSIQVLKTLLWCVVTQITIKISRDSLPIDELNLLNHLSTVISELQMTINAESLNTDPPLNISDHTKYILEEVKRVEDSIGK